MDYEKKYKEAFKEAEKIHKFSSDLAEIKRMKQIFPELKESEDERIRKFLIEDIKDTLSSEDFKYYNPEHTKKLEEALAWLEKQGGKKKPYGQRKECFDCQFNYAGECKGYCTMKRDEQKPDDKVEPKFKVGDWVVHDMSDGKKVIRQIINMTNKSYILDGEDFNTFYFNDLENDYHLWTIQDAKDGDVLCCESGWTCIFKSLNSDNISFSSYCFMDNTGWFCETSGESHTLEKAFIKAYNGEIYPATKEQRSILFQKIKETGYEWDAEKKELKLLITNGGDFFLKWKIVSKNLL